MVNKAFKDQLGKNMKACINNILVKSMDFKEHLLNLLKVSSILHHHQIKLKPFKYSFSMKRGIFFRFFVTSNETDPNH